MKRIEDMTYEELVEYATMRIHSGLLEDGGKGMKSSVFIQLQNAITWRNAPERKKAKSGIVPATSGKDKGLLMRNRIHKIARCIAAVIVAGIVFFLVGYGAVYSIKLLWSLSKFWLVVLTVLPLAVITAIITDD